MQIQRIMNPNQNQNQLILFAFVGHHIIPRRSLVKEKNMLCCQGYRNDHNNRREDKKKNNKKKNNEYTEYIEYTEYADIRSPSKFNSLNLATPYPPLKGADDDHSQNQNQNENENGIRSPKTLTELETAVKEIQNTFTKPLSHSEKQYVCDILLEILSRSTENQESYLSKNHKVIRGAERRSKALEVITQVLDYYDIFE